MNKELKSKEIINKIEELPMAQYIYNAKNNSIELSGIDDFVLVSKNKLKALEIIKEKGVNVGLLSRCATIERYNKGICYEPRHLTQEEYDLLKEELL